MGDPKQSIYRFRRADIAVYNQAKQRFRQFGDVLELVTNFRSRPPIEQLVNRVFQDRFPTAETPHQAAFAPLRVRPAPAPASEGVHWYRFEAAPGQGRLSGARIARTESRLLASWIRARIDRSERRPGDFLVLTTRKGELATYARALEAQGVPVQVTGAGVGAELELTELVLLLRALADPDDAVLTLSVLEGLFFGLSHQDLLDHVRGGGRISLGWQAPEASGAEPAARGPVADALDTMRSFWSIARRMPADIAVATIVNELGILPWAAAGELGSTRAGAVVYAVDAVRSAARHGAASLADAIEILETALAEEVDAPLIPGEADAVRVMNLHKAKGLEAPVVVLAYPAQLADHAIQRHVSRGEAGDSVGWLNILDPTQRPVRIVGRPKDWPDHEAAEKPFEEGEAVRLLYVAATRAAEELVVARCDRTADGSCWAGLHEALDTPTLATEIRMEASAPPDREPLQESGDVILERIRHADDRRRRLSKPSYRAMSVTDRVHGTGAGAVVGDPDELHPAGADLPDVQILYLAAVHPGPGAAAAGPRGRDWGSAVHRAIEATARGVEPELLPAVCRAALVEFDRPIDAESGEPVELAELVSLVEAVVQEPLWERARAARRVLVEAPFSFAVNADQARRLGIADPAETEILDGTIDLAFQDQDGRWTVVDFKTDSRPDPERQRQYERQLRLYVSAFGPVSSR